MIESLPFNDEYFDTVLSIDVFCSVKDPHTAMNEVKRVLKKGGKAIFVEHGLTGRFLKDMILYFSNILTYLTVGSSMTRKPLKYIKMTNFQVLQIENLKGSFKFVLVTKN